ncbi:galactose mutarotase [Bowmanella sp. Y26]|uniref:aldose epimerase family protein n=1 Tax=Bowmanella yangjiangensis TaxID=2811230 RepID=UPI001BDC8EEA|nr:aldose epimerase family protein [Bowmanella yangjiangensis]MBT1063359.1 galactose mutarotase [Bowmanella yangjiangensis]
MNTLQCFSIGHKHLKAEILDYGARLHRLTVQLAQGPRDILLSYADPRRHLTDPFYLGATVGRYANRLSNGRIHIAGQDYRLDKNDGTHCLHGGQHSFSQRYWQCLDRSASHLLLELVSEHLDMGFPGRLQVQQRFEIQDNQLAISYQATTDSPTVVSLTNHAYFNLSAAKQTLAGHRLQIHGRYVENVDQHGIPCGQLMDVTGSLLDFQQEQDLFERLRQRESMPSVARRGGFDHCYRLATTTPADTIRPVATLSLPQETIKLSLLSDQRCLQLYTGNYLHSDFAPFSGLCLELQNDLDGPNQQGANPGLLLPTEMYQKQLVIRLGD